ncbi:MAG: hypothetical protein ACQEW8_10845 [Actinomycetota bacterium]
MVLAAISFFALAVLGLGMLSVATDTDIIAVPGLGQLPGIVGMIAAVVSFALSLRTALRREHPSFLTVPGLAFTVAITHLLLVWGAVFIGTGDIVIATVVAADLVRGGASVVLLVTAAIAGWGGIALRRTAASRPRWPWEDEDPDAA